MTQYSKHRTRQHQEASYLGESGLGKSGLGESCLEENCLEESQPNQPFSCNSKSNNVKNNGDNNVDNCGSGNSGSRNSDPHNSDNHNPNEYNTAPNKREYKAFMRIAYNTQPYKTDFVQLMWPIKIERKSSAEMGGALGLYYPAFDHAVIDDLLYGEKYAEVWVHENIHRHNGASEQNVRERTKYRIGNTYYH